MKSILQFTLLILFLGNLRLAAAGEERNITFRVLCYQHHKDIKYVSLPVAESPASKIPLPTSGFGEDTKAKFTNNLVRFHSEIGESGPIVAEGKLASGDRQVFLLLPCPDPKYVYNVIAINDDETSFPMGSTRVLNLGNMKIRINLAGADCPPIGPGGSAIYPMVKSADAWGMFTARVDFEVPQAGWTAVSSQSWKASNTKRDWVITTLNPKTKQPTIKMYQDIPPWRLQILPVHAEKTSAQTLKAK